MLALCRLSDVPRLTTMCFGVQNWQFLSKFGLEHYPRLCVLRKLQSVRSILGLKSASVEAMGGGGGAAAPGLTTLSTQSLYSLEDWEFRLFAPKLIHLTASMAIMRKGNVNSKPKTIKYVVFFDSQTQKGTWNGHDSDKTKAGSRTGQSRPVAFRFSREATSSFYICAYK